jgi:hypothetical protein
MRNSMASDHCRKIGKLIISTLSTVCAPLWRRWTHKADENIAFAGLHIGELELGPQRLDWNLWQDP